MLTYDTDYWVIELNRHTDGPMVNVSDLFGDTLPIDLLDVLDCPVHEAILEGPFNCLMEQVRQ
jgi:hypothetical protein